MLTESASARRLLLIMPAPVVGVASALVLLGISLLAEQLQDVLRETLPEALSIGGYSSLWMIVMRTATGLAVGLLCVTSLPGWLLVTGRPQMQLHGDGTPLR